MNRRGFLGALSALVVVPVVAPRCVPTPGHVYDELRKFYAAVHGDDQRSPNNPGYCAWQAEDIHDAIERGDTGHLNQAFLRTLMT